MKTLTLSFSDLPSEAQDFFRRIGEGASDVVVLIDGTGPIWQIQRCSSNTALEGAEYEELGHS